MEKDFSSGANFICGKNCAEVVCALKYILNFSLSKQDKAMLCSSSLLYAEIECGAGYFVKVYSKRRRPCFEVTKEGENGDFSQEYLNIITVSPEEQELELFCKSKLNEYPQKLVRYKNTHTYYSNFAKATDGLGGTRAFRKCLSEFTDGFEAKNYPPKNYMLNLNLKGEFVAQSFASFDDTQKGLDKEEYILYCFACFLQTAAFWYEIRKMRDMHYTGGPFIVENVFEYAGGINNAVCMANMAQDFGRQVLVAVGRRCKA